MSETCQHSNPLERQGTSQPQRFIDALDPENVKLHDLDASDWMEFALEYAHLVNYYPMDDPENPDGDWQHFFTPGEDVKTLLNQYGEGNTEPHLALFISFLKLLAYPQQSLNRIPRRHLDFYYKEVLQLKKKPLVPDRVHVLFELAQNARDELIAAGILLDAGDDSKGNPLNYETTSPLVVNQATVASIRSVFVDESGVLKYASDAASSDGLGADLEDNQTWSAFGDPTWPEAELSFYLASHLLSLKEGLRTITLGLGHSGSVNISKTDIEVYVTGEKDWLGPYPVDFVDPNPGEGLNSGWKIVLGAEEDPVVSYNEEVHQSGLKADVPALKLVFKNVHDYQKLRKLKISDLKLFVDVQGIESLQLQNELGNVDPSKPFMPFGSSPKVGSSLSVVYDEIYGKKVTSFGFDMMWLNLPGNFTEHYKHYHNLIYDKKILLSNYLVSTFSYSAYSYFKWDQPAIEKLVYVEPEISGIAEDPMKKQFKVKVTSPYSQVKNEFELFSSENPLGGINLSNAGRAFTGEIELTLTESFYHELYNKLYVSEVVNASKDPDTTITPDMLPNEPYTPLLDFFTFSYSAEETVSLSDASEPGITLYHRHPFGVKRVTSENFSLLPDYQHKYLYVGLEDMKTESNISLLFQVAEGSEDPEYSDFSEEDEPGWHVLSGDTWKALEGPDFVRNDTNNFLKSGIVEIRLPKEATKEHRLLDGGKHWLRIELKKPSSYAVSQFINIHAQASEAVFFNQQNTTDHLTGHLRPDTISQLVNRRASIKSVKQPYPSFGGKPEESEEAFYRRVSERLRHKNRAVSIWDYEHLVLEEFPDLYKVKCLNHTRWDGEKLDELSPGDVTLVLVPRLAESNTQFRKEPKVSQNFLDEVESYVQSVRSIHADITTANPLYEAVRFDFKIRFREGLDFNYYQNKSSDDLTRLLAPWVFESSAAIRFGESFYRYEVINYLENLGYVDYIEDFTMYHQPVNGSFTKTNLVKPSNPMAILVPAENHNIEQAVSC